MKLNKIQTEALAISFTKRHNDSVDQELSNNKKRPDVLKKSKEQLAIWDKLDKDLKDSLYNKVNLAYLTNLYGNKIATSKQKINRSEIENKIIIASIDSKDVEEIKSKLEII